jgi:hypothetical protein
LGAAGLALIAHGGDLRLPTRVVDFRRNQNVPLLRTDGIVTRLLILSFAAMIFVYSP